MSSNTKRKRSTRHDSHRFPTQAQSEAQQADFERTFAQMHVQAYEAEISRGPAAWDRAQMLEVPYGSSTSSGLIPLNTGEQTASWGERQDDVFTLGANSAGDGPGALIHATTTIWVDRYDARLLLDPLFMAGQNGEALSVVSTPSSSGWSDLPEDAAETFGMSTEEAEDYHRDKRRRLLEEAHDRRLKEREAEDAEEVGTESLVDQEPSSETLTLMQRTASHLVAAANPAQLEMRILANHGSDARFTFMRAGGKSWNIWLQVKQEAEAKVKAEKGAKKAVGIGALAGYSSNEEDEAEGSPPPPSSEPPPAASSPPALIVSPCDPATLLDASSTEETIKATRREKARLWLEQRRSGDGG